MKVLLLRHGETPGNRRRAYIGSTDEPLSPQGREQAQAVAVPPVERVYGSPMLLRRQTAEILFPGAEYHPVPDLRECDFGAFEGKSYEELKDDPAYRSWIDSGGEGEIPEGESAQHSAAAAQKPLPPLWRTQPEGAFPPALWSATGGVSWQFSPTTAARGIFTAGR